MPRDKKFPAEGATPTLNGGQWPFTEFIRQILRHADSFKAHQEIRLHRVSRGGERGIHCVEEASLSMVVQEEPVMNI